MYWIAISLLLSIVFTGANYNLTKYDDPIIKKSFGETYLYNEIWFTLHFIDIQDIILESKHITNHINALFEQYTKFQHCNAHFKNLKKASKGIELSCGNNIFAFNS